MISGRMYEFLAGAILVNFKLNSKFHKLEKNLHFYNFFFFLNFFFLVLCLFISIPAFFLKFENNFLNIDFRTFVLIIFLMNLIFFSSRSSLAKKLLGNKIIVYIGKISYPLYLVHWPIFSMLNIIFIKPTISSFVFGFLFSIVLSALIYHMIETPLKRVKNLKKLAIYLCCIMFLISLVGITIVINKGFQNRIGSQLKLIVKGMSDWKPFEGSIQKTISGITINSNNSEKDDEILVIGDSLAVQYWPMVHKLSQEGLARKISFLTRQGCSPVKNFHSLSANCSNYHEEIFELLQSSPKIKKIIISSSYNYNFNIIGEQTFDLKNLTYHDHWMEPILIKKGVDYIKTSDFVCPNSICKILDSEGYPIFFDDGHFTTKFVRTGLPAFEKLFIR
jgi:hypothetical protein